MVSNDSRRPLIGLTTYLERTSFGVWETEAAVLHGGYVEAVTRAGGVPLLLPPVGFGHAELASALDGLVLVGGADIEPSRYGQEPHPTTVTRPARDEFEFALLDRALAAGLPVLGVCRGMEVLNVAFGGTLTQHLPDRLGSSEHQPAVATFGLTDVRLAEGSRAAAILGGQTKCRCYHHQAVEELGEGLQAVGWAADGTIEAVEVPGERFVLGVQWHPEQDLDDFRLFAALVGQAGKGKA
ncbi:gamma-glutamyl-gamma-aminobutyrate hydrolase family protein [Amycolatopsis magusensis]|uniref:Glutamine amidotransferase n=1 Tax=Amycolatopsis magusensis TaxID=882444 RepID=A0ABS4Q4H4_9PSEU|nr:gamma-glutamyl-gamma-aminobutyrate hydrolase family protein [Amycolatopsis magusensis]MBP2186574.1 putative glutamine amidotransferase [Amycolatopsis magusensis]